MAIALTTKKFIHRARKVHGNKYDYSKVKYIPGNNKVEIICKKHGSFFQNPFNHLKKEGCPVCGTERTNNSHRKPMSKKDFIKKSRKVHGNKYDYSKVKPIIYSTKKIIIICKRHGEFLQRPIAHLSGQICYKCSRELIGKLLRKTRNQFIKDAKKVHGNKYYYSKVEYINNCSKVIIICKKHGEFLQLPLSHLHYGCAKCHQEKMFALRRLTTKIFIKRSKKVHNNKYDYSKVVYVNSNKKVIIGCPIHGDFLQAPADHLKGHGCPSEKDSKGIKKIIQWLKTKKIIFEKEKIFKKCSFIRPLRFDFYLPEYNICIEYDGPQHFIQCKWFESTEKNFKNAQKRDKIKNEFCKNNNITLIRIPYTAVKSIEKILKKDIL